MRIKHANQKSFAPIHTIVVHRPVRPMGIAYHTFADGRRGVVTDPYPVRVQYRVARRIYPAVAGV